MCTVDLKQSHNVCMACCASIKHLYEYKLCMNFASAKKQSAQRFSLHSVWPLIWMSQWNPKRAQCVCVPVEHLHMPFFPGSSHHLFIQRIGFIQRARTNSHTHHIEDSHGRWNSPFPLNGTFVKAKLCAYIQFLLVICTHPHTFCTNDSLFTFSIVSTKEIICHVYSYNGRDMWATLQFLQSEWM